MQWTYRGGFRRRFVGWRDCSGQGKLKVACLWDQCTWTHCGRCNKGWPGGSRDKSLLGNGRPGAARYRCLSSGYGILERLQGWRDRGEMGRHPSARMERERLLWEEGGNWKPGASRRREKLFGGWGSGGGSSASRQSPGNITAFCSLGTSSSSLAFAFCLLVAAILMYLFESVVLKPPCDLVRKNFIACYLACIHSAPLKRISVVVFSPAEPCEKLRELFIPGFSNLKHLHWNICIVSNIKNNIILFWNVYFYLFWSSAIKFNLII